MAVRYEISVGLNAGHKTTKIRRVTYKGNKKLKGLRGSNVKNVSEIGECISEYSVCRHTRDGNGRS